MPPTVIADIVHGLPGQRLYALGEVPVDAVSARRLLAKKLLVPSVTTVIAHALGGQYRPLHLSRVAATQHDLLMRVDEQRRTLARAWYGNPELLDVALDPRICPTLIPDLDALGAKRARTLSRRWLRVTAETAKGKHTLTHLEQVLDGGPVADPNQEWTLWSRYDNGTISKGELQVAAREQARTVTEYLHARGLQGLWVLAMLPDAASPDPYALPVVVEAETRGSEAATEGTRVHTQLEALLRREYSGQEVAPKVAAARAWLTDHNIIDAFPELPVVGDSSGGPYAGTADALTTSASGERLIVDWKTGRFIDHEQVRLQVAALAAASNAHAGIGVHLQDGRYREVPCWDVAEQHAAFGALTASWWATWAA